MMFSPSGYVSLYELGSRCSEIVGGTFEIADFIELFDSSHRLHAFAVDGRIVVVPGGVLAMSHGKMLLLDPKTWKISLERLRNALGNLGDKDWATALYLVDDETSPLPSAALINGLIEFEDWLLIFAEK